MRLDGIRSGVAYWVHDYTITRKITRVFWDIHCPRLSWSSHTLDSVVRKFLAVAGRGWCRAASDTSTMVPPVIGRISEPRVGWPNCRTESTSHSTADKGRNRLGLGQKGPASRLAGY